MQDIAPFTPELPGALSGPRTPCRNGRVRHLLYLISQLLKNLVTSLKLYEKLSEIIAYEKNSLLKSEKEQKPSSRNKHTDHSYSVKKRKGEFLLENSFYINKMKY